MPSIEILGTPLAFRACSADERVAEKTGGIWLRTEVRPGPIVFPSFVDGPEIATQLFVLGTGAGPARGVIEFYDPAGEPLVVILR